MPTNADLYDQDFFQWTQTTAAQIRVGKWQDVDVEAIAEELESLGKRDWRELGSRLHVLMTHLLKWRYQAAERARRGRSWENTIDTQRTELAVLLRQSPSLRPHIPALVAERYPHAVRKAARESGLPRETFPPTCPWTAGELLDPECWPEA